MGGGGIENIQSFGSKALDGLYVPFEAEYDWWWPLPKPKINDYSFSSS